MVDVLAAVTYDENFIQLNFELDSKTFSLGVSASFNITYQVSYR